MHFKMDSKPPSQAFNYSQACVLIKFKWGSWERIILKCVSYVFQVVGDLSNMVKQVQNHHSCSLASREALLGVFLPLQRNPVFHLIEIIGLFPPSLNIDPFEYHQEM